MELNPYAKYLDGAEPLGVLERTNAELESLTSSLTAGQIERVPAPGKWNIRQIVVHLTDCEIAFAFRLRQTLSLPHAQLQPFDQASWAERYESYDFLSARTLFGLMRAWNLKLLSGISALEKGRPATHPERGTLTLWTLVETTAGHDLNHLQQLERLVLRRPDLGKA